MCDNCKKDEKEVKDATPADHECKCGQHEEKKCDCECCEK